MIEVRLERPSDHHAVRQVLTDAFGRPAEAVLVDVLRTQVPQAISLVAEIDGQLAGHVLFTPVVVEPSLSGADIAGLAPLAVAPSFQRKGVGSALVCEGLRQCRARGMQAVVVLGDPEYYARFGFSPAGERGLTCEFPAPPEAWQVIDFEPELPGHPALVRYHPAFHAVGQE